MRIGLVAIVLALCVGACGGSDSDDDDDSSGDTSGNDEVLTESEITTLIGTGDYTAWMGNSEVTAAQGNSPHGKVRSFVNEELEESMASFSGEHPVGAESIKELYDSAGENITGYAYSKKVSTGSGGDTWLWYEDLDLDDSDVDFYGTDVSTCTGCHSSGDDFIRVEF